jgi:hypothetical protein
MRLYDSFFVPFIVRSRGPVARHCACVVGPQDSSDESSRQITEMQEARGKRQKASGKRQIGLLSLDAIPAAVAPSYVDTSTHPYHKPGSPVLCVLCRYFFVGQDVDRAQLRLSIYLSITSLPAVPAFYHNCRNDQSRAGKTCRQKGHKKNRWRK